MLEAAIEAKLVRLVKAKGGVLYRLDPRSKKGAPDRVVVLPGRPTTFVELKTDRGRLSPLQVVELDRIRAAGGRAVVLYGATQVQAFVDA
jgi:hypothetical protein